MTQATFSIRDARASDEAEWRRLWQDYLAAFDAVVPSDAPTATWRRLLDPASPLSMRVAVRDERLVGFAIHFSHPTAWATGEDCCLEDLCVDAASRGAGIGRALLDDLIALARAKGFARLYWLADGDNAAVRRLYDSHARADGFIRYRLPLGRS